MKPDEIKEKILELTREYSRQVHYRQLPGGSPPDRSPFVPGETTIPYAGRVFDEEEVVAAISSTLDFWLTLGPEGERFERSLADFLGVKKTLCVNSGSSANLVAFSALTSPKISPEERICPGDEVITVAAGFPTTVAPIIQNRAVPVFIDANPITGNAMMDQLEAAYDPTRTKAVMMAHALGNPFDLGAAIEFCRRYDLWLIEDNCDALGCSYTMPREKAESLGFSRNSPGISDQDQELTRYTGSWGDLSTQSFYPPHHLTMGEGGAVNIVRDMKLKVLAESFRDWGRDCWCPSGKDNTCNKRFGWHLGELPEGYDHKYIYSHLGYNLKPLDPQAAIGGAQMSKLPAFIEARRRNWQYLRKGLEGLEDRIDFALPTHATAWNSDGSFEWDETGCRTDCSWFGFAMSIKDHSSFSRTDLARKLEEEKIGNRMLFGGNLVRQPAFVQLAKDFPGSVRIVGNLAGADRILNDTLFVGTYPGLSESMLDHVIDTVRKLAER